MEKKFLILPLISILFMFHVSLCTGPVVRDDCVPSSDRTQFMIVAAASPHQFMGASDANGALYVMLGFS